MQKCQNPATCRLKTTEGGLTLHNCKNLPSLKTFLFTFLKHCAGEISPFVDQISWAARVSFRPMKNF